MYGTVMRYRLRPDKKERATELLKSFQAKPPPGFEGSIIYRLDSGDDEYIIAARRTNREAYLENAKSDFQNQWFQSFRECLAGDVQWNDGEVVEAVQLSKSLGSAPQRAGR